MKCIKYLVAALTLGATLVSCSGVEEPVGTVGQTIVQFESETVNGGFGSGYIYVPITIFGANAAAMNTADVNVKVRLDETYTSTENGVVVAKEDLTGAPVATPVLDEEGNPVYKQEVDEEGKPVFDEEGNPVYTDEPLVDYVMGDIRITSKDMVFINNYNIADDDKDKPFKKNVGVEIMIVNTKAAILEFKLVIESSNTQIGDISECVVRLEKSLTDELCGEYKVSGGWDSTITWNASYECFEIFPFESWNYCPIYAYWDPEINEMYMLPYEPLMWYDSAAMQMCYSLFWTAEGSLCGDERVVLDYDIVNGTIKFPEELALQIYVCVCDEGYNPVSGVGYFTNKYAGLVMTKKE